MKVMILAAGRGKRMAPLTDHCPKPLLQVAGKSLLEHHILALKAAGFKEFVINVAYLGDQIKAEIGSGEQWGVNIEYSDEGGNALETGGGIHKALPLLGDSHFLVVNADVWADFPYAQLRAKTEKNIHLVLVENPSHNKKGDFNLLGNELVAGGGGSYTYSGIGVFSPSVFANEKAGVFPLAPIIREEILRNEVSGQLHLGLWVDVGTPERLASLKP